MFLFHAIHFFKFLVKSQPQSSYKKGSYMKKKKSVISVRIVLLGLIGPVWVHHNLLQFLPY